jgi:hypothetical protein
MEKTQKYWIIMIGFATLLVGSWLGRMEAKRELQSRANEIYAEGWSQAMGEFLMLMNEHTRDTNRVTEINFISCVFCDSTDLLTDTVTYYISPKNIITK